MVNPDIESAVAAASASLGELADPEKASAMQAYMKTDMPFYGVQRKGRDSVLRSLAASHQPANGDEYRTLVLALWGLPHREEKYLAIAAAIRFRRWITPDQIDLFRRLIIEGAWWDLVDDVAIRLVGRLVVGYPDQTWAAVDDWVDDDDQWLRRAAIICQVGAKDATDVERLFDFCGRRSAETDFFIRKAIGWALRDYARTDPVAVAGFLRANRQCLSTLSFREAAKHIGHLVSQ